MDDPRTKGIAARLGLSAATVKTYKDRIYRALQVSTITQAVAIVIVAAVRLDAEAHSEQSAGR